MKVFRSESIVTQGPYPSMQYYRYWIYFCNVVLVITSIIFVIFAGFILTDVRLSLLRGVELYDPTFLYAYAALILQCGVVQTIGCLGAQRLSHKLLSIYWILLLLLTIGDVVVGVVWVFRLDKVKLNLRQGLSGEFTSKYSTDETFTRTWNQVQTEEHCCGVDGPLDYDKLFKTAQSKQFKIPNNNLVIDDESSRLSLPESCCIIIYDSAPVSGGGGVRDNLNSSHNSPLNPFEKELSASHSSPFHPEHQEWKDGDSRTWDDRDGSSNPLDVNKKGESGRGGGGESGPDERESHFNGRPSSHNNLVDINAVPLQDAPHHHYHHHLSHHNHQDQLSLPSPEIKSDSVSTTTTQLQQVQGFEGNGVNQTALKNDSYYSKQLLASPAFTTTPTTSRLNPGNKHRMRHEYHKQLQSKTLQSNSTTQLNNSIADFNSTTAKQSKTFNFIENVPTTHSKRKKEITSPNQVSNRDGTTFTSTTREKDSQLHKAFPLPVAEFPNPTLKNAKDSSTPTKTDIPPASMSSQRQSQFTKKQGQIGHIYQSDHNNNGQSTSYHSSTTAISQDEKLILQTHALVMSTRSDVSDTALTISSSSSLPSSATLVYDKQQLDRSLGSGGKAEEESKSNEISRDFTDGRSSNDGQELLLQGKNVNSTKFQGSNGENKNRPKRTNSDVKFSTLGPQALLKFRRTSTTSPPSQRESLNVFRHFQTSQFTTLDDTNSLDSSSNSGDNDYGGVGGSPVEGKVNGEGEDEAIDAGAYYFSSSSTVYRSNSLNETLSSRRFQVYRHGCRVKLIQWVDHVSGILFIWGFCIIGFVKAAFLIILRTEIREMIEKIQLLELENPVSPSRTYNKDHRHVSHPLLFHPHRASTVSAHAYSATLPTIRSPEGPTGPTRFLTSGGGRMMNSYSGRRHSNIIGDRSSTHSQETVNMTLLVTNNGSGISGPSPSSGGAGGGCGGTPSGGPNKVEKGRSNPNLSNFILNRDDFDPISISVPNTAKYLRRSSTCSVTAHMGYSSYLHYDTDPRPGPSARFYHHDPFTHHHIQHPYCYHGHLTGNARSRLYQRNMSVGAVVHHSTGAVGNTSGGGTSYNNASTATAAGYRAFGGGRESGDASGNCSFSSRDENEVLSAASAASIENIGGDQADDHSSEPPDPPHSDEDTQERREAEIRDWATSTAYKDLKSVKSDAGRLCAPSTLPQPDAVALDDYAKAGLNHSGDSAESHERVGRRNGNNNSVNVVEVEAVVDSIPRSYLGTAV